MAQVTRFLIGLLLFTLPFDQAFEVPFVGSLSRAIGMLVALAGLLTLMSSRVARLRRLNLFLIAAGVFVVWNAFSVVWTVDRASTVVQVFTYIQLWILIWLLWQFIDTSAKASGLRQAYMLGTWITIGTVTWAFLSHNPTLDPTRFTAFDTNENYTAQSIALAIPLAFDAAVHGRSWSRLLAALLVPACLFGIALTGSRSGGIVAAVAVVGSVLVILQGKALTKAIALAAVTLIVAVLAASLPAKMIQRFGGTITQVESADFSGRGDIWKAGFEAWLFHPAVGAGAGNFGEAVIPTLGRDRPAHNSFLGLLVELGPIGPALFFMLFLVASWPHLSVFARGGDGVSSETRRYAALHVILVASLLLAQLATNWQYQRVTWYILIAATFDGALFLRAAKRIGVATSTHGT